MYLTEEEAKKKWCPQARMEGDDGGTWNRTAAFLKRLFGWTGGFPLPEEACNCIASECMMWRERVMENLSGTKRETDGYCGLAGKP